MIIKNTPLMPIYQYIFKVLQNNNIETSINILKDFYKKIHLPKIIEYQDVKILSDVISVLESFCEQPDDIDKTIENITLDCTFCSKCKKCRHNFWKSLGKYLNNDCIFIPDIEDDYYAFRKPPTMLTELLETKQGLLEVYGRFGENNTKWFNNKLVVLKGFSSSTPALLNSMFDTSTYTGGGLYINWFGKGIVIDPGYNFLQNMHHYDISVLDISTVIVTHEHIDHSNDLRILDDLIKTTWKLRTNSSKIKWYVDKLTFDVMEKYQEMKSGFSNDFNEFFDIQKVISDNKINISDNIAVSFFHTNHIEKNDKNTDSHNEKYEKRTYGCTINLFDVSGKNNKIMYTSDTSYMEELIVYMENVDVLIANISGIYEDELMLAGKKAKHLGYYGCYNILKGSLDKYNKLPSYTFLSEFWNGTGDIRFDVTKYLKDEIQNQISQNNFKINCFNILPAEVGMAYDIENNSLKCSVCGKYSNEIMTIRPFSVDKPVQFVCPNCYYL